MTRAQYCGYYVLMGRLKLYTSYARVYPEEAALDVIIIGAMRAARTSQCEDLTPQFELYWPASKEEPFVGRGAGYRRRVAGLHA